MKTASRSRRKALMMRTAASALALALVAGGADAQEARRAFEIAPQPLADALLQFARQADIDIVAAADLTRGRTAPRVVGELTTAEAMNQLLAGSGLQAEAAGGGYVLARADAPQSGSAAGDGAEGTVEALIVTAQKREEDIQDVPIAISAFTQEALETHQIAGGPDLITQVPNMTFTKTNFSSYSVQLRGIGTQAISATTDPAVAVAFNNTPFIRNRFFEQEFYDLQRVEVLRGPQGTLYGRNATAGVVNIISAKPKFIAEAKLSGDVSNFNSTRLEGMVNIPIVEDVVALRLAGAWTKRDGYATNELTGNPIDGRDLWSTRLSLRVTPNDRLDANLIWEHFEEDDDRLRSGKQLCKKDVVTEVGPFTNIDYLDVLPNTGQSSTGFAGVNGVLSQGCQRNSLYAPDSYQTPVGIMLPYYNPLGAIGLPTARIDPYQSEVQTQDLRIIESTVDPTYQADTDIVELQVSFDLTEALTLASETAYGRDFVYSLQDFNRFNTAPGAWRTHNDGVPSSDLLRGVLDENGVFCDPQLGCSDRLVAVDVSTDKATQFSQEVRLSSDFDGPFNFSLGANYLRADSEAKYYVFINSLSLIAADALFANYLGDYTVNETDNISCLFNGYDQGDPDDVYSVAECVYMDPNPIETVNDRGHNYFLSKNPYKLISYAVFGEAYYNITDNLKVTAGLRWTVDKKDAPRIPTWVLAAHSVGYPVAEVIEQEWREPTGRLTVDWKPDLAFTDETLVYASYAHGYKAGGANPPGFVRVFFSDESVAVANSEASATRPRTFEAEFVDAYEIGAKNTLLDGQLTLNLAGFYYDYTGYQISEIVDRSAFNRNFDATVWGLEIEADWRPLENLKLSFKGGHARTRLKDGEQAIDLMDRTAGDPAWSLMRPFPTFASSCIVPTWLLVGNIGSTPANPDLVGLGGVGGGNPGGCELAYIQGVDPVTRRPYVANPPAFTFPFTHSGVINYTAFSTDPALFPGWPEGAPITNRTYPGWNPATAPNNGEGIMKDLSGNELPNAPNYTVTLSADYTVPLPSEWLMTLHTDLYWQSESWWRVFNDHEFNKLDEYFTTNIAAIFANEDAGWRVMAYVKNVFDRDSITGAFLNSDDTGLTTNVFLTEPRLYGLRVTKQWTGGPLLGGFGARREGPYPFTVELGGQVQRHEAPNEPIMPGFSGAFTGPLAILDDVQDADLDWGDGREVKLSWRPGSGPWNVSLGIRYGRTNGSSKLFVEDPTPPMCGFPTAYQCAYVAQYPNAGIRRLADFSVDNHVDTDVADREQYDVVEFAVGRDFGIGSLSRSTLSAGLQYAQFTSATETTIGGVPDWFIPANFGQNLKYLATHTVYESEFEASREFEGVGPVLSWDAALAMLDLEDAGRVDVDWSLTGGVLFGDREMAVHGTEMASRYRTALGSYIIGGAIPPAPFSVTTAPPVGYSRSEDVTVPVYGASLGLSYSVGGFKAGAGYRWERYQDAIDGGFAEAKDEDRTIDGPYFKISVGFGGG